MLIRNEKAADIAAIDTVTLEAFKEHPHSNNTEHFIVRALRENNNLPVSLVAEVDGLVVGHVALSRVSITDGSEQWFGLGPVSVKPNFQNNKIGSQLIEKGLSAIQALGANGCVVLGEPEYYGRFGFKFTPRLSLAGVPPEYFQILEFNNSGASGEVSYDVAFEATS